MDTNERLLAILQSNDTAAKVTGIIVDPLRQVGDPASFVEVCAEILDINPGDMSHVGSVARCSAIKAFLDGLPGNA